PEEALESPALHRTGAGERFAREALENHIELLHAAAAAPQEAPGALRARALPDGVHRLSVAPGQHFLDLRDRLGRIEVLRADVGAVHDGMAAVQPEGILELIEPLAGRLVAAVDDPAVSGQQGCGTEEPLA